MARPSHKKSEEKARLVRVMAQYGAPQEDIAHEIGISVDTLAKYYAQEYAAGKAHADVIIRQTLFDKAVKQKDTACLIFLCKTRLGMRETNRTELVSPDGSMSPAPPVSIDLSEMSPEDVAKMARAAFRGEA